MKTRVSLKYFVSYCRSILLAIYKAFGKPHLDYDDIIYDKAQAFNQKLESTLYSTCLNIKGAIKGSFEEKLYQELGLEYLQSRQWYRLCFF